ncbi:MAG: hypothetical protein KKB51_03905 [Candidatus Riflebacteria bacterium]|nr:hypothetical protein [Candidatus Riflebacteria bacterium]
MKMRITIFALVLFCMIGGFNYELDARRPDFIREPNIYRPPENIVDVDIIGDNRGVLTISGGRHHETSYIEAQHGERYTIRVRNNWHGRIALVVSVDGRNIISGERSYNRPSESMYALNPGQTGNFDGWRSSYSQTQRFYFTSESDSYSGRMGDYSQIGWIKIAVFRERYYQPPIDICKYDDDRAKSMESRAQAGTGYGEGSYSPVSTTSFDAENFAAQLVNIRYEWPEVYIKKGTSGHYHQPEYDNSGFTRPPPR